ncbi:MAG: hypothetical protein GY822_12170 [Deltaproteobacteria bacterium]|nr:hypothetical protein [Deltaproteobacteria bacterium]
MGCAHNDDKAPEHSPGAAPDKSSDEITTTSDAPKKAGADLKTRIGRYATPSLSSDISALPESEQKALAAIIEAAKALDPIFDRQAWAKNEETLKTAKGDTRRYLKLMRGPWDRQDHFAPVVTELIHPKGAGFYPEGLSEADFRAYLETHPEQKEALSSLTTMVVRDEADATKLKAIPYSVFFKPQLELAAAKLNEAAELTQDASLKTFLKSRAKAFLDDDYYQSDKDWMDLDSAVEVTIGPYEVYEDELMGLKASFETFVTITDEKASKDLARYKAWLPDMEKNLPIPDAWKTVRGGESPIRVVDLVYTSGEARKSVQTIAFNLPNDERVRKEKGAKKVMLRNAIQQKFETILRPIAGEILDESQLQYLDASAFFDEVLFHELSHSLGPAFVKNEGKVEVRVALGGSYSAVEECKADVMGAYNILFLIDRGDFPAEYRNKLLISYFAGLFRSVRFGVNEAHGKGAAVQINRSLEDGAATFDDVTGKFTVDLKKLEESNKKLLTDLLTLEHNGDKAAVDAFLGKYGVMSPTMRKALDKVLHVPTDIRPIFPLAGESGDPLLLP